MFSLIFIFLEMQLKRSAVYNYFDFLAFLSVTEAVCYLDLQGISSDYLLKRAR
jgi:hypothetical protein